MGTTHKCVYDLKLLAYIHNISTPLTCVYGHFMMIHTFAVVDMVAVGKLRNSVSGPTLVGFLGYFKVTPLLEDHVCILASALNQARAQILEM